MVSSKTTPMFRALDNDQRACVLRTLKLLVRWESTTIDWKQDNNQYITTLNALFWMHGLNAARLNGRYRGKHVFLLMPWRETDHLAPSSLDVLWSGIREASKWWTQVSELALAGATGTQTSSLDPTGFFFTEYFYEILISFSAWNILIQHPCNSIDHKNYLKIKVYEMEVLVAPLQSNPGAPPWASRSRG